MDKCSVCGLPNGSGDRELRPYGDNDALVCWECMSSDSQLESRCRANFERKLDEACAVTGECLHTVNGPIPKIGK